MYSIACSLLVLATWHTHTYEDNDVRLTRRKQIAWLHLTTSQPGTSHRPLYRGMEETYAVRAASIRLRATCRLLRPESDEVARASLSFARSTSESDAERMIST